MSFQLLSVRASTFAFIQALKFEPDIWFETAVFGPLVQFFGKLGLSKGNSNIGF
jgi:hypothetical protein